MADYKTPLATTIENTTSIAALVTAANAAASAKVQLSTTVDGTVSFGVFQAYTPVATLTYSITMFHTLYESF
jgi:hypothetical protein